MEYIGKSTYECGVCGVQRTMCDFKHRDVFYRHLELREYILLHQKPILVMKILLDRFFGICYDSVIHNSQVIEQMFNELWQKKPPDEYMWPSYREYMYHWQLFRYGYRYPLRL